MIFFTADLHLGHENIMKQCQRPFRSVEQMDNTGKRIYIVSLSDFGMGEQGEKQYSFVWDIFIITES